MEIFWVFVKEPTFGRYHRTGREVEFDMNGEGSYCIHVLGNLGSKRIEELHQAKGIRNPKASSGRIVSHHRRTYQDGLIGVDHIDGANVVQHGRSRMNDEGRTSQTNRDQVALR